MYYTDFYKMSLLDWRRGLGPLVIVRQQQGADVAPLSVLDMLNAAKEDATPIEFSLGFTQLHISHQLLLFEKSGQKKESYRLDLPECRILFGESRPTFRSLSRHIRSIPLYHNYEIKVAEGKETTKGTWYIKVIRNQKKEIILDNAGETCIVHPDDYTKVYPRAQNSGGGILQVLEPLFTQTPMTRILPSQNEEFFGKTR